MRHQLDCLARRPVSPQFMSLCAFPVELENDTESLWNIHKISYSFVRFDFL